MKRELALFLSLGLLFLCSHVAGDASVPQLINYQGQLLDSGGQPLDGVQVDLTFRFYDAVSGGTLLLTVQQTNVQVTQGLFHVLLGSGALTPGSESSLGDVFRKRKDVWMSTEVNSDGEMSPRIRIATVPR